MRHPDLKTSLFKTASLGFAMVAALSACNEQKFSVPSEQKNFGQHVTYTKTVDILWVIDTSTSMSKHQGLLADQAGLFVNALNQTGLDYQMAVTTMDMSSTGAKGRLLAQSGTPAVLKATTPNLTALLSQRLRVGDNGSPTERGQEAMKTALTSGSSTGFLRSGSLLAVIFLTNEDDKSATENYTGFLDQIRPPTPWGDRSWVAHFMGVVPNDPSCKTSEWNYASPGVRYMDLASASGGVAESICDADLRRALTNVKARVLEMLTEYPLERKPLVDTIRVYVNGVEVPQDSTNGWSYYAPANSVRFHGTAVPPEGARIQVTFDPDGLK